MIKINCTGGTVLTADLSMLAITGITGSAPVTVELSFAQGERGFFSQKLSPVNGALMLYDLGQIIEAEMDARRKSSARIVINVAPDDAQQLAATATIPVVYFKRYTPGITVDLLASRFLSAVTVKRVCTDDCDVVSGYPYSHSDVTLTVFGEDSDGYFEETSPVDVSDAVTGEVFSVGLDFADLTGSAMRADISRRVKGFVLKSDGREMRYYIDEGIAEGVLFCFRNAFGCVEYVRIAGVTEAKPETSMQLAQLSGNTVAYDLDASETFSLQSAPIPAQEIECVKDLMLSPEVYVCTGRKVLPVIITDHTLKRTRGGSSPDAVKFSWRYADNRVAMDIAGENGSRFTREFTQQFN